MNVLPVITRELRVRARRPSTVWLRVTGAIACVGAILWLLYDGVLSAMGGAELFVQLHYITLLAIWILVPLMVSDTLSSELRDGTLGLLFLTPLTPLGVVVGKAVGHLIVALTLWISIFPVIAVPVLMGGVSLDDLHSALLLHGCSILLALSAGMLASSLVRQRTWSAALSVILAALMAAGSRWAIVSILQSSAAPIQVPVQIVGGANLIVLSRTIFYPGTGGVVFVKVPIDPSQPAATSVVNVAVGIAIQNAQMLSRVPSRGDLVRVWSGSFARGEQTILTTYLPSPPAPAVLVWPRLVGMAGPGNPPAEWWIVQGAALPLTLLLALAVLRLAAASAESARRERVRTATQERWHQRFFGRRYLQRFFRRRAGRLLDHNPIIWLHGYSIEARLGKWGWCLLSVLVICALAPVADRSWAARVAGILIYVVLGGLAHNAARSFAEEKRSGAFELILITPVREYEFIVGRLLGLWLGFVPTLLLIWVGCVEVAAWNPEFGEVLWSRNNIGLEGNLIALFSGWVLLPVIGLSLSLWGRNVLAAWIGTVLLWLLPVGILSAAERQFDDPSEVAVVRGIFRLAPGLMIGIACWPFQTRETAARVFLACMWFAIVIILPPVYFFRWDWSDSTNLAIFNQVGIAALFLSFLFRQLRERRFVIDGGPA